MKQSPETIAKRIASMKKNRAIKEAKVRERLLKKEQKRAAQLPLNIVSNGHGDAEEFAKFMAAAWKVYKGQ